MRQDDVGTASEWRQDGVRMTSGMYHGWRQVVLRCVRMASEDVRKMSRQRQDGVRMASRWRQGMSV